jgi:hypothetical protein
MRGHLPPSRKQVRNLYLRFVLIPSYWDDLPIGKITLVKLVDRAFVGSVILLSQVAGPTYLQYSVPFLQHP